MQLNPLDHAMAAKTAAPAKAPREALLIEIAAKHFCPKTLETPNKRACPRLDFYNDTVWSICAALEAAFATGQAATRRAGANTMTERRTAAQNDKALEPFLAAKGRIDQMLAFRIPHHWAPRQYRLSRFARKPPPGNGCGIVGCRA